MREKLFSFHPPTIYKRKRRKKAFSPFPFWLHSIFGIVCFHWERMPAWWKEEKFRSGGLLYRNQCKAQRLPRKLLIAKFNQQRQLNFRSLTLSSRNAISVVQPLPICINFDVISESDSLLLCFDYYSMLCIEKYQSNIFTMSSFSPPAASSISVFYSFPYNPIKLAAK